MIDANYTTSEAAKILRCSGEQIRREVKAGRLRGYTIGNGKKRQRVIIPASAIDEYIEANTIVADKPKQTRRSNKAQKTRRWV
ncbi:Helix-turn-helix domain protein [Stieleria neptunia]|uniref:Helix-turn-helix domain protein n=1 Tax=Stieleria neptunia TaxID=2527979 RepID=A0A518HRF0_9BACT|nr:helix-turn-helix domain-containing protein [Stieleria neptunia]QDV43423.1 Helix-turn-helix domain protein [Stieleria neptunia]